jgi:hypothetical protein
LVDCARAYCTEGEIVNALRQVFGEYISVYDFRQSIQDGATVPLYYENRIPELQLTNANLNEEMEDLLDAISRHEQGWVEYLSDFYFGNDKVEGAEGLKPQLDAKIQEIVTRDALDEFFHRKYEEDEESGDFTKVASAEDIMADQEAHREAHMHMPSPSYWPMVIAFGLPVVAIGLIFSHVISVLGALLILIGAYGWVQEPSVAESDDYDPPSDSTKELATVE